LGIEFLGHQVQQSRVEQVLQHEVREGRGGHQSVAQAIALVRREQGAIDQLGARQVHAADAHEVAGGVEARILFRRRQGLLENRRVERQRKNGRHGNTSCGPASTRRFYLNP
jgi:hypothetical protein